MKKQLNTGYLIIRLLLGIWALFILIPVSWIIYESLKTNQEFFMNIWALPKDAQLENYGKAWKSLGVMRYMGNTAFVLVLSLTLSTMFAAMGSYILGRFQFKLNKAIFWYITVSMMLPGLNAIATQFVLMKQLRLTNSLIGLSIFMVASVIPFSIFILIGFMKTIPKEMEESAYMDGSSYTKTFFKVIMPMCKPGMLTINIFNFLSIYNIYLAPLLFINDEKKYPIAVGITKMYVKMQYKADWVTLFAGSVITMVPVMLFYAVFQKHLISGTTLGAVKG